MCKYIPKKTLFNLLVMSQLAFSPLTYLVVVFINQLRLIPPIIHLLYILYVNNLRVVTIITTLDPSFCV